MVTNGRTVEFGALVTGTELAYSNAGRPAFGPLTQGTNVSITISGP